MAAKRKSSQKNPIVYQEFGRPDDSAALERAVPDLPPQKQDLRIRSTRSGRKGKTVTVITGFQHSPTALAQLLKKLKNQCGSGGTIKDSTLEIQGDQKQQLLKILTKLGYKAKIQG
ncbi:MAG: translation initiation factor [Cyanobacteria bacterium J06621_8]